MSIYDLNDVSRPFSFLSDKNTKGKISDRAFVAALTMSLPQESASGSLEGLRRSVMEFTQECISKQSFHERLGTQKMHRNLEKVLNELRLVGEVGEIQQIAEAIGVDKIFLQDASTIALPNDARFIFKGVNTDKNSAALKVHATFELCGSCIADHSVSAATENDTNFFVNSNNFEGNLTIADLGYYSFERFTEIANEGGFFLSRLKSNATSQVVDIQDHTEVNNLNKKLNETEWTSDVVDVVCNFGDKNDPFQFRVVGFWNQQEEKYHFYVTNLLVDCKVIWLLYRIRWQVELAFKALKQSLTPDRITTSTPMIIRNLVLIYLIRHVLTMNIGNIVVSHILPDEELSLQKAAKTMNHLVRETFNFIVNSFNKNKARLINSLKLFATEFVYSKTKSRLSSLDKLRVVFT